MDTTKMPGKSAIGGWAFSALMLVALPLLGIVAAGRDPAPYLEMPPTTRFVQHAGFSRGWFAFFAIANLLLAGGLLMAVRCGRKRKPSPPASSQPAGFHFPWWG
jgi:hypothetical protein